MSQRHLSNTNVGYSKTPFLWQCRNRTCHFSLTVNRVCLSVFNKHYISFILSLDLNCQNFSFGCSLYTNIYHNFPFRRRRSVRLLAVPDSTTVSRMEATKDVAIQSAKERPCPHFRQAAQTSSSIACQCPTVMIINLAIRRHT